MKIQINGFDIEINTDDETMSVKIIDASGKELSNNTYSQTMSGENSEEITEPDMTTPEETASQEAETEEEPQENTDENTDEAPSEDEEIQEEDMTLENENFMPTFEQFKKLSK